MGIKAAGLSHPGRRESQQDCNVCEFNEQTGIFAVIDGMGGPQDGDRAAETTRQFIAGLYGKEPCEAGLVEAFNLADAEILRETRKKYGRPKKHPGCVATAVWLNNGGQDLHLAHQGDTRAYRSDPNDLESMQRLTTDHSAIVERLPGLTEIERMLHPKKSIVTRSLGNCCSFPDYGHRTWKNTYGLLLCSDGLCDVVHERIIACVMAGMWDRKTASAMAMDMFIVEMLHEDFGIEEDDLLIEEVEAILARATHGPRSPEEITQDLIDMSLAYQRLTLFKADNVTAVVIKVTL